MNIISTQTAAPDTRQKHILIIEDDPHINAMIKEALSSSGYSCTCAFSGTEGLMHTSQAAFDLIILDLMLPGMNGTSLLHKIREGHDTPIIVLSALDELDTKVELLTLGANDYMTKPFEVEELKARILVQLRSARPTEETGGLLSHRGLCLDEKKKLLTLKGEAVSLTAHEYNIIALFLKNPQRVFSKQEIYEYAWDNYYIGEDKTINVHISNIRQKLKKVCDEEYIETVWGLGFKLV